MFKCMSDDFNFYKKAAMRLDSEAKRRHMELVLDSSCTNIGNKGDTPAAIQHVLSGSKLVKSVSSSESETSTEPESRLKNYQLMFCFSSVCIYYRRFFCYQSKNTFTYSKKKIMLPLYSIQNLRLSFTFATSLLYLTKKRIA